MNTETTDNNGDTLLYDSECAMCRKWAARFQSTLRQRGVAVRPLPTDRAWDEMKLRTNAGQTWGGADAAMELARRIWWAWPVWVLSRLPGAMPKMRRAYRWVAERRKR